MPDAAVLFDLDDTLLTYERSGAEVLEVAFERVGVEPFFDVMDYLTRYDEFFEESTSIAHLRELIFTDIAESAGRDPSVGVAVAEAYEAERDHSKVVLLPGAKALLDALDGRPLGLVTNGDPEMQRHKLEATGLESRFDSIVYAGHDSPAKPDPTPFHLSLDRLESSAEFATFVGNDPRCDVDGAHAAGMEAAWLRNGTDGLPERTPKYTIDSLEELLDSPIVG